MKLGFQNTLNTQFLSLFFNPVMLDKEALPTSYLNLFARCSQSEVGLEGVGPKTEGPSLRFGTVNYAK